MLRPENPPKRVFITVCVFVVALITEFVILEGTAGISLPSDRNSALSTLEITAERTGRHFITRNKRFSVVDFWTAHGTRREAQVLRETVFMDREDSVEGSPNATVTVEAMKGKNVRWTFREPGERGDVVTNKVYMVTLFGNGEGPNTYTYFSLVDGRKARVTKSVELSRGELEALDTSIAEQLVDH
jgi:hypothetical protein